MTPPETTQADFDTTSWHDNHIYAVSIVVGDIQAGDWRSELVLDIDHIVEWVRGTSGGVCFRVAPASLTFHNVTDARLSIDWGASGFQVALSEASINHITREQISNQKICLDRPYYSWRIILNHPAGGEISFGASGYTQTCRCEPVLLEEQKLTISQRVPFTPGAKVS